MCFSPPETILQSNIDIEMSIWMYIVIGGGCKHLSQLSQLASFHGTILNTQCIYVFVYVYIYTYMLGPA